MKFGKIPKSPYTKVKFSIKLVKYLLSIKINYLQIKILDNDSSFITPHLDLFFEELENYK